MLVWQFNEHSELLQLTEEEIQEINKDFMLEAILHSSMLMDAFGTDARFRLHQIFKEYATLTHTGSQKPSSEIVEHTKNREINVKAFLRFAQDCGLYPHPLTRMELEECFKEASKGHHLSNVANEMLTFSG